MEKIEQVPKNKIGVDLASAVGVILIKTPTLKQ
jgi:hypothetical protein